MFLVFNCVALHILQHNKGKTTYAHRLRPLLLFSRDPSSSSVENFLSSFRELDCLLGFSVVETASGVSSVWAIEVTHYFGNKLRFIVKNNNNKSSRKTLVTLFLNLAEMQKLANEMSEQRDPLL